LDKTNSTGRPKCYGFDTGFVTFIKGWDNIREDDRGLLWEHLVLDTQRTAINETDLYYWRNKSGREIDFIIRAPEQRVHAVECKINPEYLDSKSLISFRSLYPEGDNYVISPLVKIPYKRKHHHLTVNYLSLKTFSLQV